MAPIKILVFEANPFRDLDLNEELRKIKEELATTTYRDYIHVEFCAKAQIKDLINEISKHKPMVVHFSGHGQSETKKEEEGHRDFVQKGGKKGLLIFNGEDGSPRPLAQMALVKIFKGRPGLRLVVLNACYTETQAKAIQSLVDCVVGTPRAIRDDMAITFSSQFYKTLGNGESVQRAHDDACTLLSSYGVGESELPHLLCAPDIDAAKVVLIDPRSIWRRLWETILSFLKRYRLMAGLTAISIIVLLCLLLIPSSPPSLRYFYDRICTAFESPDPTVLANLMKYRSKPVSWEGITTEISSGGGRIWSFKVKPVGINEDQKRCQHVSVIPDPPLDAAFLGAPGEKVRFKGTLATMDKLNGITITDASVWKTE